MLSPPLSSRWRAFGIALASLGVASAAVALALPSLAGLVLLALYCVPANSILPVPHEPGVLFAAALYPPLAVAVAATLGSVIASISDYALVETALRSPKLLRARDRGVIGWSIRQFRHAPFAIVVLFSLVPLLPISLVRALAPASGYPFRRYLLAGLLGRLPRFYGLAYLGHAIAIPAWVLVIVTLVTLGMAVFAARSTAEPETDA
jgi:membrane protein YqaA with SNARE-associated domain